MNNQLATELRERYSIVLHDVNLLEQAFTHSSYVSEHRYLGLSDSERPEFLGDAVLELIVSQYLYLKFLEFPGGKLTKIRVAIVREGSLARFVKECHFDSYISLGRGEEVPGGRTRTSLLCDLFEAFLGALYLDQKVGTAKKFTENVIFPRIDAGVFSHEIDHRAQLQEVSQHKGGVSAEYHLIKEEGPAHDYTFFTEVYVNGELIGPGQGEPKKLAEQDAAERALKSIPQQSWKERYSCI